MPLESTQRTLKKTWNRNWGRTTLGAAQRGADTRSQAVAERQPYCLWVRRDDGTTTANNLRREALGVKPPS
jgi:hypothetical protein